MTSETTNNMLVRKLVFNNGKWTDEKRDQPDDLSVFAKLTLIIFMIIGRIELLTIFILFKKFLFKN